MIKYEDWYQQQVDNGLLPDKNGYYHWNIELFRKRWGKAVNKALENDNEPKVITEARRQLFMGLFDDYVKSIIGA